MSFICYDDLDQRTPESDEGVDMPRVKTEAQERAKLRANEERRAQHAYATLVELLNKHNFDERELQELYTIFLRLKYAIQHQHIKDERYAQYKAKFSAQQLPSEGF